MKKLFALILTLAMAFSLVACGGSSDSDTDDSGDTSSASSASTSEAESSSGSESEGEAEASSTDDTSSDGELIVVGFAQVGHESDWRTASTESCQSVFTEENGYELVFVDCGQDSAAQLEAGETSETTVYMEERWYTYADTVSTFEVDGVEQSVTVVTDEIIDAQYGCFCEPVSTLNPCRKAPSLTGQCHQLTGDAFLREG